MRNWIREIGIIFDGLIADLACIDVACHAAARIVRCASLSLLQGVFLKPFFFR